MAEMDSIRVAVAQLNTAVGDISGNTERIADAIRRARGLECDLVAVPELAVTGYPPEDLLLSDEFVSANLAALDQIVAETHGIFAAIGFVERVESSDGGAPELYNAVAVAVDGRIVSVHRKHHLPNYGVFDERRYFTPGDTADVVNVRGVQVGFSICEDIWVQPGPADTQCESGARLLVSLNASPYEVGKLGDRFNLLRRVTRGNSAAGVYVHQVGGQDELVFDGASFVIAPDGSLHAVAPQWQEGVFAFDVPLMPDGQATQGDQLMSGHVSGPGITLLDYHEDIYAALVVGTRDYVRKTGFSKVAVAISGGIDSALVATIATDALGADNVVGVNMPSRYSSDGSMTDSEQLAAKLGIPLWDIPIEPAHSVFEDMLASTFAGTDPNTAEENVQARIRGNVIMTVANKFGWLVLTTGNKSEMATGYATLYGDMAGGFAVIKDIPKGLVYELARHRNSTDAANPPIPQAIIDKPPSAELRPDQTDQDSLPDYDTLDAILAAYVEERKSAAQIVDLLAADGTDSERAEMSATVARVVAMVDRNEYKRRQSPPGVKITGLAFGRDRRMPIASGWGRVRGG